MTKSQERKLTAQYKVVIENTELRQKAVDTLAFISKQENETVYSIGFKRWQKLTKKQITALSIKFNFDTNKIKNELQNKTAAELLN